MSGLFSVDFSVSEFREYHYEESLKSSLLLALANVLYLGLETDFEDGSLRAFLLENVDVVNRVLSFTEGTVSRPDSGLSVVQRIMAFYS